MTRAQADCGARTVENLGLLQKPLEPTPVELDILEFLKNTTLVNLGVVSKLCTLYEREYDSVLEAGEDGPNPLEGERVSGECVIRLHGTMLLSSSNLDVSQCGLIYDW